MMVFSNNFYWLRWSKICLVVDTVSYDAKVNLCHQDDLTRITRDW